MKIETKVPLTEEKPDEKFLGENVSPDIIGDHAFEPKGEWYTLCKHCSLAQAAHAETTIDWRDHMGYYGDDNLDD